MCGFVVFTEGLDMFRLRVIATGGKRNPSGNLSLGKEFWLGECLGADPREVRSLWLKASVT
jgi:hypothetical protein